MIESFYGKKYLRDQSKNGIYIVMIILGILGFLASLFLTVQLSVSGIVAISGAIQLATRNKPIFQFHKNYFEYKPAPLASVVLVRYQDIMNLEDTGRTINVHTQGRNRPVKVILNLFKESERDELVSSMRQLA